MVVEASHLEKALSGLPACHPPMSEARPNAQIGPGTARIRRIARLSAETSARFVRERIFLDPVDWLFTPKRLFDGRTPIEACRTRGGFAAAMILHEYSLGLDCAPASLAGLPEIRHAQFAMVVAQQHLAEACAFEN